MTTELINEKSLVKSLIKGDDSAFSALFKMYSPILQSFLKTFNLPLDDINDIIQSTFLKIWENRESIRPDQSFKNYIITIAKNDLLNQIQKNIVRQKNEVDVKRIIHTTSEIQSKELQNILEKILEQLPSKRGKVYHMSRVEGYSNKEIAKNLGISKSTVENHINHTSSIIKKILKNVGFLFLLFLK